MEANQIMKVCIKGIHQPNVSLEELFDPYEILEGLEEITLFRLEEPLEEEDFYAAGESWEKAIIGGFDNGWRVWRVSDQANTYTHGFIFEVEEKEG